MHYYIHYTPHYSIDTRFTTSSGETKRSPAWLSTYSTRYTAGCSKAAIMPQLGTYSMSSTPNHCNGAPQTTSKKVSRTSISVRCSRLPSSATPRLYPYYSIHDKLEPFGCKAYLFQCGEFYMDTTIIENTELQSRSKLGDTPPT